MSAEQNPEIQKNVEISLARTTDEERGKIEWDKLIKEIAIIADTPTPQAELDKFKRLNRIDPVDALRPFDI